MNLTALGIFIFYGIIIGIMAFIGFTISEGSNNISQNVATNVGYVIGVIISIILWEKYGKSMAMTKKT